MSNCVFVTFPCGILGPVWYLIVSIPDLCHLSDFGAKHIFDNSKATRNENLICFYINKELKDGIFSVPFIHQINITNCFRVQT